MAKYTPEEREALAAAGRRLGLGKRDGKITDLRERTARAGIKAESQKVKTKKRQKRLQKTESECLDRRITQYKLQHLRKADSIEAYDVTNPTRYPAVEIRDMGCAMLEKVLKRYAYAMRPHGITPGNFRMWREHFMLMNPEQLGALVRVSARTIRNWESGETPIPFSMWWVMHVTMQDPEYFLTRPGFHDFYIEYVDGVAHLCSHSYPDIRWTATDLYFNRCALNEVLSLREEIRRHEERFQGLTAENTRLRQMLKTEGVTAELQAMQDHIGELLKRIQTADVMPFQAPQASTLAASPIQKFA